MPIYNFCSCRIPSKNHTPQGLMPNWDENYYLIVSIYPVSSCFDQFPPLMEGEITTGGSLLAKGLAMLNFP